MFDALSAPRPSSLPASPRPADDTLDSATRESVDYQILRRTLGIEDQQTPGDITRELRQKDEPPAVSSAAEALSQAVVEQRGLELEVRVEQTPQQVDPLVLDLAGNGFSTSGLDRPLRFDLDADGRQDSISAPVGDDALLALDRNGNGHIDDGRELFGDQHGAANGFAELARFDDNGDGRIDTADAMFDRLRLLRFDAQGRQQLQTLGEAGVSAIDLRPRNVNIALGAYDQIAQLGQFEFADGRSGQAADLLLAKR
ncbi:hypothetical protein OU800_17745 [Pseudomonas sp. GOM7]|uniref:hypothetical protein n=1 Tax=unclassified Pseudomonas TaxID=196821 RepID=UPI00227C046B|nr:MULTISPECIES: hypothetical protein [unclassified Pseudomonas]WAJ36443.1 hypothetical protein OU800_17745 [Pseudomonas sp. GOM7]